jgi:glucose-6-phosphate 1-dehydrogenase
MTERESDALVVFGATGDLSYKKIFPSLQSMAKRGALNVPVVGVGREAWDVERIRARARESLESHGGGVDQDAFARLAGRSETRSARPSTSPFLRAPSPR